MPSAHTSPAVAADRGLRSERSNATREAIITAAERLFAEHGVSAVSNRQVSEAAGQGNNTAVAYHFGTKADLVHAIVANHAEPLSAVRERMLTEIGQSPHLRDWVGCFVYTLTDHLEALGNPSFYARFAAQAMADPTYSELLTKDALTAPSLVEVMHGINRCLPTLPAHVRAQRGAMMTNLLMYTVADRERALAAGALVAPETWDDAAAGLVDGIVGLWQAPVTLPRRR
jgi:AcrR family transcriptional regulator